MTKESTNHLSDQRSIDTERADRSYLPITEVELNQLALIAKQDRVDFFGRYRRWERLYSDRMICVALCQGAALHYLDNQNGIKDWVAWTFYRINPEAQFPYRRIGRVAFGDPRFGRSPGRSQYLGRRIDLIGRSIYANTDEDPVTAVRRYVKEGRTKSARLLAEKAVILIDPTPRRGEILWPIGATKKNI